MEPDRVFLDKTSFARTLRNNPTAAEYALWQEIRASKLGYKFTRQFPIGRRFADFCCRQSKLVIEVDGASHEDSEEDDKIRDDFFTSQGYVVLRFTNAEVLDRMSVVLDRIRSTCEIRPQWRY